MNKNKIAFFVLLLFIPVFHYPGWSQNTKYCDSLIAEGINLMWKKDHVKSLECLIKAKTLSEKNKWYQQSFNASNNIGGNYYLMLNYGEALNQYLDSYKIALAHLDESYEMIVLNNIAILYTKENKFNKAKEYFFKAYGIAQKRNDPVKIGYYSINLASVLNEMGRPKQAEDYIRESFALLKEHPDILYLANIVQAENDLLLHKTDKARKQAMALFDYPENKFSLDNQSVLSIIIAKSFIRDNNLAKALEWSMQALRKSQSDEKKIEAFELLSSIYIKQKNYRLALHYTDSINATQDNLDEIKNGKWFESNQIKFQLQDYKKQIAEKSKKIESERFLYGGIVGIITLVMLFISIMYRSEAIKNKQFRLIAERNEEIARLKLQKQTDDHLLSKEKNKIVLLEQEKLRQEVALQNQKIASRALYLSGKDQLLQEILSSLGKMPELSKNKALAALVKELKKHLGTEDEWNNFTIHFEEVSQGLLQKLKSSHPKLSQNDLRYISYEYMNLSTKEISALLNITPDACRKRKERVVTKLELADSSGLKDYLANI